MKKIFLSSVLCLLAFSFLKAQSASLVAIRPTLDILKSANEPLSTLKTPTDTLNLSAYCGIYKMQNNEYVDKVDIWIKDGHLVSKSPEDDAEVIFVHTEADEFYVSVFSLYATFIRVDGIVKSVEVRVGGQQILGEKL